MKLVLDANVLFSALIKNSKSAELIVSDKIDLVAPEFVLREFEKHKDEIVRKLHRSLEGFEKFWSIVLDNVEIVSYSELERFLKDAEEISPNSNDVQYFCVALKENCPIWSNDKKLKNQESVEVCSTEEILGLIS